MHTKNIVTAGKSLHDQSKVLIMVHGRGANAQDILSLASNLYVGDFTLMAPQATSHTWYPYSFLSPPALNQPWLSSALLVLHNLINDLVSKNIPTENIYFLGFSQGACLTLEYVCRNAIQYGGVAAFTGGLIGDNILTENYKGDFNNTPVFLGTGDPDPHVPVERVHTTASVLKNLGADVLKKVYPGMGHTINQDEIDNVNKFIFKQTKIAG